MSIVQGRSYIIRWEIKHEDCNQTSYEILNAVSLLYMVISGMCRRRFVPVKLNRHLNIQMRWEVPWKKPRADTTKQSHNYEIISPSSNMYSMSITQKLATDNWTCESIVETSAAHTWVYPSTVRVAPILLILLNCQCSSCCLHGAKRFITVTNKHNCVTLS